MDSDGSEPAARSNDGGGPPPVTPLQRLIAGIALLALLASAAISSWWILSGRVDFLAGAAVPPTAAASLPTDAAPPEPEPEP